VLERVLGGGRDERGPGTVRVHEWPANVTIVRPGRTQGRQVRPCAPALPPTLFLTRRPARVTVDEAGIPCMESSGTVLAREAGAGDAALRQRTRFVRGRPPRAHAGANSTLTAEHELGKHGVHVQSAGR
jgi:hypothetical protein